jgi:hypothetical protein
MSALLFFPALTPFVLLGLVMGLSWLEDHILPPPDGTAPIGIHGGTPRAE